MLIIPQLPDVEPAPTKTYHSDNRRTRNIYIRTMDLERFGHTAGCPACEVHRARSPTSGQEHTAECRKRLEDVITTDASTSTRVEATRVRQAERIRNSNDPGVANPSSSSGSGQHKRVRFADQERPDPKPERDTEMRAGSQEAHETRRKPAETDAERLEEEATSAEADSERRLALKRKAEGDLDDSGDPEVEDSVMNSHAKSWHRENDPYYEVDLLILQQRDCHVASVHETGGDKPVCEEPETPFPYGECGWDCVDDTSGKLLNNTLVEKARAEEMRWNQSGNRSG